jgi:hypothetical protein
VSQSKTGSLIESLVNIAIGFTINCAANMLILPLFGYHITLTTNLQLGVIYTGISIARSYCIRRWFNARIHRFAEKVAA